MPKSGGETARAKASKTAEAPKAIPTLPTHGASDLTAVSIEDYNLEVTDEEGFVGDRAKHAVFTELLDAYRKLSAIDGEADPFGSKSTEDISKKTLDRVLSKGDPQAGAVIQSAIEDFSQELAAVIARFVKLKAWRDVEHIVIGGGFRASRIGELVIERARIILRETNVSLSPITHHPDEAGLIGCAHLLPPWMLKGHDAIIAVDIGGTNIRCGLVELNLGKSASLSKAAVSNMKLWRHGAEEDVSRTDAVKELIGMLNDVITDAKRIALAPVIAIGCPGIIEADGSIQRGAQNLPGNWEAKTFNLSNIIRKEIATINEQETVVIMHNDAVVQGLSEIPNMMEYENWGVLTIGTGLGNAHFATREPLKSKRIS